MMIRIPEFELPAGTGQRANPSSYQSGPLVVIFLPSMRSSLHVLLSFDERLVDFAVEGSQVLAIANENLDEVSAFTEEHSLQITIVADEAGIIIEELSLESACHPVVTLVDRDLVVRESVTFPGVHIDAVIDRVRRLRDG